MIRTALAFGLIAGVLASIPLDALVLFAPEVGVGPWGMAIGYGVMLLAFSIIFVAVKRRRDRAGGGVIGFWPALGLGLGISVVASFCYVLAWELAVAAIGYDFPAAHTRAVLARAQAARAGPAELARLRADIAAFRVAYADPLWRLPMSFAEIFPVGLLVALAAAALLRDRRLLPPRHAPSTSAIV